MASVGRAIGFAIIAIAAALSADAGAGDLEKQQATGLYGRNYAVVAPIYTGAADGNVSYVRLVNDNAAASTFMVNVVGSPSGRVYGTANILVAGGSSPQYAISAILNLAAASALNGGDTSYALYLQDADQVGFQHVIYNNASGFFENASVCEYNMPPAAQPTLRNVHTSQLSSYPAQIALHNYYNGTVTYHLQVTDSATGAVIGSVPVQATGNSTTIITEASLEQQLKWTPSASQPHVTLTLTADGFTSAPAILVDLITNARLNSAVNMSAICAVNDNAGTCVHDPNGQSHACTQGSNIIGGAFSVATYTLTISPGSGSVTLMPQGITCEAGGQCNVLLSAGSTTTLMATPGSGAQFLGWSGACSDMNACTLTMTSSQSVTASFTSLGY